MSNFSIFDSKTWLSDMPPQDRGAIAAMELYKPRGLATLSIAFLGGVLADRLEETKPGLANNIRDKSARPLEKLLNGLERDFDL